jgi:hypothetical protein
VEYIFIGNEFKPDAAKNQTNQRMKTKINIQSWLKGLLITPACLIISQSVKAQFDNTTLTSANTIINEMRNHSQSSPPPAAPRNNGRVSGNGGNAEDNNVQSSPPSRAEERRSLRSKEAMDKRIQKAWMPISRMDDVTIPRNTISIAPGTRFFNRVPSNQNLTAPLAGVAMNGTTIPRKALRRAIAILAVATKQLEATSNQSNEEISFLAGQAAAALDGGPLQVIVNEAEIPAQTEDSFQPILSDIGRQQAERQEAAEVRKETLKEFEALKKEQDADGIDPPLNFKKHQTLADTFVKTEEKAGEARDNLEEDNKKVVALLHFDMSLVK